MKLKIINTDGLGRHTKVVNAETGELLENVTHVEWHASPDGVTRAVITLLLTSAEIEARMFEIRIKKDKPPATPEPSGGVTAIGDRS